MSKKEARIVLFSITLCWASSYIIIKDIPEGFSTYAYLTLTSGVAGILLALVFHQLFRKMNRRTFIHGTILALLITGNMLFEKLGLERIPASAASVFASMNIIIVPIILVFLKKYPSRNNVAGIIIIIAGIALSNQVSMAGSGLTGALFMLASCVMMSLYTVLAADFTKTSDPLLLTVLQLCITSLIAFVLWVVTDPASLRSIEWSTQAVSYIFIIAFFSKAYAYMMLMYAEKYADAISVTVIAAMEPVVTLLLAVIIPTSRGSAEVFSARSLAGAFIITLGAIVAGTEFLSKSKKSPHEEALPDIKAADIQPGSVDSVPAPSSPAPAKRFGAFLPSFILITVLFALLGVSVNIAEFAEGFSEIRPENFLSIPAGILLGPVGGLACALGNLIADSFYDYEGTQIIGFLANFMLAYIPFKVWLNLAGKRRHVHTWKNLLLFIFASFLGSLTCSALLSHALEYFFAYRYDNLMSMTFWNNLIFTIALGLPCFIVLTREENAFWPYTPKNARLALPLPGACHFPVSLAIIGADTLFLLGVFIGDTLFGLSLGNSLLMRIMAGAASLTTIGVCLLPPRR